MSQPKSAAEVVAEAKGRVEEPIVRYKRVVISRPGGPEVFCSFERKNSPNRGWAKCG